MHSSCRPLLSNCNQSSNHSWSTFQISWCRGGVRGQKIKNSLLITDSQTQLVEMHVTFSVMCSYCTAFHVWLNLVLISQMLSCDNINIRREFILKGLVIYLNKDPDSFFKEYVLSVLFSSKSFFSFIVIHISSLAVSLHKCVV